jgi:dTMP kinase
MTNRAGEEQRHRIEAEIKRRNEAVARMKGQAAEAEAEAHRTAEEIRLRAEEQARRRAEAEARLIEEEARLQAVEEGRLRRDEEAQRLAEEFRLRAESEWGRRAGIEARLQYELEAQERAILGTQLLAAEGHPQAVEVACRHRVEAEVRLIEAEARLQNEHEASARDEEEP